MNSDVFSCFVFFSLPPSKRLNYIKLGMISPFQSSWEKLMKEWTGKESFYVLRDRHKLIQLKTQLKDHKQPIHMDISYSEALIPVMVTLKQKGTLVRNSHICIPTAEDLLTIEEDNSFSGPVEPQHDDVNESKRKSCRSEHKTLLKRLSRKRKKERKNEEDVASHSSETVVSKQKQLMRELWLPNCENVKDNCSRTTFGFVVEGGYSFTSAKTVGIGYVSYNGLIELVESIGSTGKNKLIILVRSTNTCQYRFAKLHIII